MDGAVKVTFNTSIQKVESVLELLAALMLLLLLQNNSEGIYTASIQLWRNVEGSNLRGPGKASVWPWCGQSNPSQGGVCGNGMRSQSCQQPKTPQNRPHLKGKRSVSYDLDTVCQLFPVNRSEGRVGESHQRKSSGTISWWTSKLTMENTWAKIRGQGLDSPPPTLLLKIS